MSERIQNFILSGGGGHDFSATTRTIVAIGNKIGIRSEVFEDPETFA